MQHDITNDCQYNIARSEVELKPHRFILFCVGLLYATCLSSLLFLLCIDDIVIAHASSGDRIGVSPNATMTTVPKICRRL